MLCQNTCDVPFGMTAMIGPPGFVAGWRQATLQTADRRTQDRKTKDGET
jgi:hypothetical protein